MTSTNYICREVATWSYQTHWFVTHCHGRSEPSCEVTVQPLDQKRRRYFIGLTHTAILFKYTRSITRYLSHSHTGSYDFWIGWVGYAWLRLGQGATDRQCLLRSQAAVAYRDRSVRVVALSQTIGEYRWQEPSYRQSCD